MKKWGRIVFCTVLAVCLWFGSLRPASADYTYTVRIFAGNVGSFDGEEALVYTGLKAGDRINFYPSSVTINPGYEKYYVKSSLQEAGKENGRTYASFEVTCDRDYVVCYGIKGKTVAYTIHYQDAAGKELRDKEVFYGNIGDKPVEAYLYVEGYRPQYYNLTGTLSAKASDNEFYFVYEV